ncbi:MAG: type II toxin-antitoxin system prevent-host-death family antitoxin [Deltaproteobacteria bacterium]|nr:type II toxin-antitoxin system prevent-host-death family antitoxin [Deltaproteobacteria bacterium]
MKNAAVSILKASLSEYLAKVKQGEEVIVTDRGKPIAKIIPFRSVGGFLNVQRTSLAREGVLELGTGKVSEDFLKPSPVRDPSGSVLEALLEEREEGI